MIDHHELRRLAGPLRVLESIALIPRAESTNRIGRRVIDECLENELSVPSALIVAEEQSGGRGRGGNRWVSPARSGIYATLLQSRKREDVSLLPLEVAVLVTHFLRSTYSVDARIKWPNDILISGKKVAGILIEATSSGDDVFLIIGIGINVRPIEVDGAEATSISEATGLPVTVDDAMIHFVQSMDSSLFICPSGEETIASWRGWSVHRPGDTVSARIGDRVVSGTWVDIEQSGHARIRTDGGETLAIASGEIVQHG